MRGRAARTPRMATNLWGDRTGAIGRRFALLLIAITLTAITAAGASAGRAAASPDLAAPRQAARAAGLPVRAYAVNVAKDGAPGCVNLYAWSNRRLAAQTVVVPVSERAISTIGDAVAEGAGGIILFGSSAPADLGTQISHLESLVPGYLGLLVMSDEEGGGVQRMANLVGDLPWPRDMAASWTEEETAARVAAVARRMASYGVNMDLAPVIDVDGSDVAPGAANPDGWRSFGGDTSVVTRYGIAFMEGLQQGGVIPVLKHFPGLGGASGNTDNGPAHTLPWAALQEVALPPFIAGIKQGAPAIMVSNAVVPGLTDLPASLSSAVIRDVLVGTLGFRGLILTDSLSAGAISGAGFTVPAAAVQAIQAGADMVLFGAASSQDAIAQFRAIVSAEVAAVANGSLSRTRLQDAATSVLSVRGTSVCS